jgi:hypothetical protein
MPMIILLIMLNVANADPLLDAILGYKYVPVNEVGKFDSEVEDVYQDQGEDHSLDNGEHYSWDNIYLCQFCDTEIIIEDYSDLSEVYHL